MRFTSILVGCGVIIAACGGSTTPNDGGTDATSGNDGSNDAKPTDTGTSDVIALDAAECTPPNKPCANPCPSGTYCLISNGPTQMDLGCTTIPPECNGVPSCTCMADCFCPPGGFNKCIQGNGSLSCDNGTVSRREYKKDIDYVSSDERADLARQALEIPLARYRYKTEPETQSKHLGFIIDDQSPSSPAVASDATHVDLYGYASMLLATVQEQQKQIDALQKQVDGMKGARR